MKRISYLEGLRGVAALIVVISHFAYGFFPALDTGAHAHAHTQSGIEILIASSPFNIFYGGHLAVCIFFVLSGYVLTCGFFKSHDYELIISSAIRRYFRLEIPILFTVLLAYMMMRLSLFHNQSTGLITGSSFWLAIYWNFEPNLLEALKQSFYHVIFNPTFSYSLLYDGVLWTMPYEFIGSFLVFGIAALFGQAKNRYWVYLFLAVLFINTYFLAFILGLVLADLHCGEKNYLARIKNRCINELLFSLGWYFGSYPEISNKWTIYNIINWNFISNAIQFNHTIGAFLIILLSLNSTSIQKIFSMKVPQFLGRISFSMYLLHHLILGSSACYLFPIVANHFSYSLAFLIVFLINMIVILAASCIMNKYIDQNGVLFSKYIYQRFFKRATNPGIVTRL